MSFDYSAIFGDLFWIDRSPGRIPRRKGEPSHHLLTLCTYIFTCYAMQYMDIVSSQAQILSSASFINGLRICLARYLPTMI